MNRTGTPKLPRLRTEYARRGSREEPFPARQGSGKGSRRALRQASATVDVGDAVPGHTDERQLYGGAFEGDGVA